MIPSIALVALVYLATIAVVPAGGFWITDDANRFLQMQAIEASGFRDSALPWPGRAVDPELRFNPLPAPFTRVVDGKLYSQYPPLFAAMTTIPFRWLGFRGLYVLPLAGALLALAWVSRLGEACGLGLAGRHAAVLLAGLCTPLWFYAVVFWEHAVVVGLLLGSVHLALGRADASSGRRLAPAWLLAAAAVYLREDAALFGAVLIGLHGAAAPHGRFRRTAIAAAWWMLFLAPLVAFDLLSGGQAFGHHLASNFTALAAHLRARPDIFYRFFVAAGTGVTASLLLAGPLAICAVLQPSLSPRAFRWALPLLAALASAASIAMLAGLLGRSPIVHLMRSNSLFPAAPWIALALVRPRATSGIGGALAGRLRLLVGFHAVAYAIAAPPDASGIHWGNRFLLVLYPVLAVLAVRNLAEWIGTDRRSIRLPALAVGGAIAISLAAQVLSIHLLDVRRSFSLRANRELARRAEPAVVTDVWWAAHDLCLGFFRTPIFLVRSQDDYDELARRLDRAGYRDVLLVTSAVGPRGRPAEVEFDDGGLGFFSLAFRRQVLRDTAAGP